VEHCLIKIVYHAKGHYHFWTCRVDGAYNGLNTDDNHITFSLNRLIQRVGEINQYRRILLLKHILSLDVRNGALCFSSRSRPEQRRTVDVITDFLHSGEVKNYTESVKASRTLISSLLDMAARKNTRKLLGYCKLLYIPPSANTPVALT
jgi:hypothetical protein